MARVAKPKPTVQDRIKVPEKRNEVAWTIVGIDPSLSRTGLAILDNTPDGPTWTAIKSLKPDDSKAPSWIRSLMMARYIQTSVLENEDLNKGLMIVMEAPTPGNDYLATINKIIHAVVLPDLTCISDYSRICVMHVNAMTMRSCLGLTAKGNNKHENIRKSHEFADSTAFPGIDSDACDAVLLAQFGRFVSDVFLGKGVADIPDKIAAALFDFTDVTKGKGRNERVVKKGIIYNPAYWFVFEPTEYSISVKDARVPPKKRLEKITVII
jgi:hypothetical protein